MLIERNLYSKINQHLESKEAIIITGMRRTGKTSLLTYIYERVPSQNKILLDLENPLHQRYFEETNYDRIKTTLEFLGLDFAKRPFLFLDEIQLVKTLPSVLKYLIDHYGIKCFVAGSASFYLKNLFTESLVGRKYLFELFPLDFQEFVRFRGIRIKLRVKPAQIDRTMFETVSRWYDEYVAFGGFPEVVLKTSHEEKKRSLEDIFTAYFQSEVVRFGDFRKNNVIRDLLILLMQRIGSRIDVTKLSSELGISRMTLQEYLSFLEGTYLITLVRPFSRNRDLEIRKMRKVYLCDSGLANHYARLDEGKVFENSVFQNLRLRGEVQYYQRKGGAEIDFILNQKIGVEVKLSPKEHDLHRLERISKAIGLDEFKVVAKKYVPNLAGSRHIAFGFDI